jgi:hypothetical protein
MIATIVASSFVIIALIHVYWALGGQIGAEAAIPHVPAAPRPNQPPVEIAAFKPTPAMTLLVATALAVVAALVSLRAGLFGTPLSQGTIRWSITGVAVVMFARAIGDFRLIGFFKHVTGSKFALMDTWFYSPLCIVLGLGLASVAWA